MNRMDELEARVGELVAKRRELTAEVERIGQLNDPTDGEIARGERQMTALDKVDDELLELKSEQREIVRSIAAGGAVENGDGPAAARRGPEIMRRTQPYADLDLVRSARLSPEDVISRAKAAVDGAPEHMDDAGREHVTRLLEAGGAGRRDRALIARHCLLTGSPEYHEAFEQYAAGRALLWTDAQRAAVQRATDLGEVTRSPLSLTDSQGGFLVPFTLDPTIILTNTSVNDPLRQLASIKQTATESWSGVTSAGVTSEWTAEGAVWADASPNDFAQPTIVPKKANSWIEGSYEVLADSGFATELGKLLADSKARLEAAAFAVGNTGATIPRGVVAGVSAVTASIVTSTAINAFAIADVYRAFNAVTPRGEENMAWIANKAIYSLVRQFDTSGGSAFWSNLAGPGVPPSLLGAPAYVASNMTGAVATNAPVLLVGNFAEGYYIVDRIGMTVQPVPVVMDQATARPRGRAGYAAYWRVGADVVNVDTLRVLKLQTTATAVPLA